MEQNEYQIMYGIEDTFWWYIGLRAIMERYWNAHVFDEQPKLLDAGCGTGAVLASIMGRSDGVGLDFSPEALRFCRIRRLSRLVCGSADSLPFEEGTFDVVVSFDVLCHTSIKDKGECLRGIARVLKPGGILFLNLPAYQWLMSSHDTHVLTNRRFAREEASGLLRDAGFEVVAATYWNTLLFPMILVTRLWRKIRPLPASDLSRPPGPFVNWVLGRVLLAERALMRVFPLPFGLSVFLVARRRE